MQLIIATGYVLQMLSFASIALLFLINRADQPYNIYFALASFASAMLGAVLALVSLGHIQFGILTVVHEYARGGGWIIAMLMILHIQDTAYQKGRLAVRFGLPLIVIAGALLATSVSTIFDSTTLVLTTSGILMFAWILLVLVEHIFRNIPRDSGSGIELVCAALLIVSVFDIVLCLHGISVGTLDTDFWAARGFVNLIMIPPMALVIARREPIQRTVAVSRARIYLFSLLVAGVLILLWVPAKHLVGSFSGDWTAAGAIVFFTVISFVVFAVLISTRVRGRARVLLTKTFFRYKYDYRKEWLRFIGVLSQSELENVPRTAVRAVAPIVNSPGGIVWTQEDEDSDYVPVGSWRCELPLGQIIRRNSSLVRFLREKQWVVDLNEKATHPHRYEELEFDTWFTERDDFWLIVPLLLGKQLLGLIVLLKPTVVPTLNFEDHDLLRTVGRHVGTHIRQADSDKRLAETSQFSTYHRLSAFLMHDLNNLIAQQSLVVKNAEKFRHDPKFVDDTIETIAHSVARMRRLMEQLSGDPRVPSNAKVAVRSVIDKAVRRSETREPVPMVELSGDDVCVNADAERLAVIIEHLIRNAQDATDPDGEIRIVVRIDNDDICIDIVDDGCGMSSEFINHRLFRPFDSTKGSQSMGIGAYQAREYIRMLGGTIDVRSEIGKGTTFILKIPVANEEDRASNPHSETCSN